MTQKTNQFNLTTQRLTEQDIREQIDRGWEIYCLSVSDKFGDNGITGAIFISPDHHIDNLLLSCRILGKGIEQAFVSSILNRIRNNGIKEVTAQYVPSKKNGQTSEFYDKLGFKLISDSENKNYMLELSDELPIKDFYNIYIK